ncbi:MAG TPA: extracellular solute-binding protein [Candidatus Limnocylindrales bacterium]|nr:extracellular solute-binding protein [Candidatus Limnocylindrales bacterium]
MRKAMLLVVGLAIMLIAGGVVMAQDDMSAVDPSGQTVVYWHQFSGAQLDTMTALVEQFNSTNEYGITVEALAQGNYNEIRDLMNSAIISGETPNLVAGYANDAASYYLDGGAVDLTPYVNDAMWGLSADQMADFNTALLDFNTIQGDPFNGVLVAFPHQVSAQVFIANNTLLGELGFAEVPQTIEDFKASACASAQSTTADGTPRYGFPITTDSSAFESWVAAMGGQIFDGTNYLFDSPEVIAALQLYADLYAEGCGYIPAERFSEQTDFALGLTPFYPSSTAGFTFVLSANADNGFTGEWTPNTFPHMEGSRILQAFVPAIVMPPSTPEAQLASWLFLKYLVSPEAAQQWSEGTGYFNPVLSTVDLMSADTFPNADLFPYFSAAAALVNDPEITLYNSPNVPSYGSIRSYVSEAVANVTSNGMTAEDAAALLQQQAEDVVSGNM